MHEYYFPDGFRIIRGSPRYVISVKNRRSGAYQVFIIKHSRCKIRDQYETLLVLRGVVESYYYRFVPYDMETKEFYDRYRRLNSILT